MGIPGLIFGPERWLETELRHRPRGIGLARRRLVAELDAAFREDRDPLVLHAPFPARGWHRLAVRIPDARYAPAANIRSGTPDEALERARELWPHAALTLIPKGETP